MRRLTTAAAIFAVMLLFLAGISYAKVDLQDCVGMWLFDEGKGDTAADTTDNAHDGDIVGPEWVDGKFDKALEFDGVEDFVNVGDVDVSGKGISILAWIKADTTQAKYPSVISKRSGTDCNYQFYTSGNGSIRFAFNNGGWRADKLAFSGLYDDLWHHVGVVYDGSNYTFYKDGEASPPSPETAELIPNDIDTYIGYFVNGGGTRYFKGVIDEVAIFSVALDKATIKDCMDEGLDKAFGVHAVTPSGKLATVWAGLKSNSR